MAISRREALFSGLAGSLAGCATSFERERFSPLADNASALFAHGVASGDPDRESVVLWTRLTTTAGRVPVSVEISETADFSSSVKTISTETGDFRDHTVKVVANGLEPGRVYHYRFSAGGEVSPAGRTRTLPERAEQARFAVVSCSNYPFGYFNAYDHIARRDDVDAVIHLGDYIYEYGPSGYGAEVGQRLGRPHMPPREIVSLADYRQRHAQYKSDPGSRAMHAAHPLIAIWDDHETANNAWERGAENHQPEDEGDWTARKRAALQAYYEWMPIREPNSARPAEALYRTYSWGGLLTLTAIETRLTARSQQLEYSEIVPQLKSAEDIERFRRETLGDPARTMLGDGQMRFLEEAFRRSVSRSEPWRLVANQVMFARIKAPNLEPYVDEEGIQELEKEWDQARAFIQFSTLGLPLNLDAWDGYPHARQRFYEMVQRAGARDLVVLTGDSHEFWANDLHDDQDRRMGVELGTTGVSSPAPSKYLKSKAADYSLLMRRENRDVRFHDPMHNGYIYLALDGDRGRADYVGLSTVLEQSYDAMITARFDLRRTNGTIEFANPRGLGFKERVVFRP